MNYQHFSHHHLLIPLKLNQDEKINCKACERLIIEPFHGCLSCNYYLHDHCIDKPRSLNHPSHTSHPLTLLPIPTYPDRCFSCNACGSDGNAFSYSCAQCEFDLHIHCASLPTTILKENHTHELKLTFDFPCKEENGMFQCGLCGTSVNPSCWIYYCVDCDFGTHLDCAKCDQRLEMNQGFCGARVEGDRVGALKEQVNEMMETQLHIMRMQSELNRIQMMTQLTTWNFRPQ
ncbi:hypothetical protein ACSBR2_017343 [Camellia fascicularis]